MNEKALQKLSYGLYVLTTSYNGKDNGCIINTANQVASSPNIVTISVSNQNYTTEIIKKNGIFNISVISEKASFDLFKRFGFQSGKTINKFDGFSAVKRTSNGVYIVTEGTNSYLSLKVISATNLGSHTLFIAEITDADILNEDISATYSYYHSYIKPKPQTYSTPIGKTIWRCTICGYEEETDELPEDFTCPLCKHPKSDFEKITLAVRE